LIPLANVGDLHLSEDVVAAVKENRFHVWAVDTIEDGIELLSGRSAGTWDEEDGWTDGSLFSACQRQLDDMVEMMRQAAKGTGKAPEGESDEPEDASNDEE